MLSDHVLWRVGTTRTTLKELRFIMDTGDWRDEDRVVRAWTVRGGENGEREQAALDEGLIILGWEELGEDLSHVGSRDDLSALLRAAYPADGPRTIDNWAYQLWQFLKVMQIGDLVVMPRKHKSVIAIGRVIGNYQYRSNVNIQPCPVALCSIALRDCRRAWLCSCRQGWHPGVSGEGVADDGDDGLAVLAGGVEVAADGVAVAGRGFRAEAAGDLLLGFRRAQVALGLYVTA